MEQDKHSKDIKIEDYIYDLPVEKIAKYPSTRREDSKLLYYTKKKCLSKKFQDLPELLLSGDILVFNNTKVIQARIPFHKKTGAKIEIFCLEPYTPEDFQLSFESKISCTWKCMVGNLKKWKNESIELLINIAQDSIILTAIKIERNSEYHIIEFSWNNSNYSFAEILEYSGIIPIPPYLNRDTEKDDLERYQTVYSKIKGSVAAPTAGLHFTNTVFNSLIKNGINKAEVTLHVSAGTFKPVSTENISDHIMHSEHFFVTREFIELLKNESKRLIAVGTTSVRTIESLYWLGNKINAGIITDPENLHISQWDPYEIYVELSVKESMNSILEFMENNKLGELIGTTQIIIVPGYKFKIVKGLITNFHMPKSTLLLLIAALVGDDWKKIYEYALNNDFRFLSYGDSSLLMP